MPNRGMPKTDGGTFREFGFGREDFASKAAQDRAHGKRITSDDRRSGHTCMACLGGDHLRCAKPCPCNICGKSHGRADMEARRAQRQVKRTQTTRRVRVHPNTEPTQPGPTGESDFSPDEVCALLIKLLESVRDDRQHELTHTRRRAVEPAPRLGSGYVRHAIVTAT